jgi:hypothetical protein
MKGIPMAHGAKHDIFRRRRGAELARSPRSTTSCARSVSNVRAREGFRQHSAFAEIVEGPICSFGVDGSLPGPRAAVPATSAA